MGKYNSIQISHFCLSGQFLDFIIKDGYKLKGLLLETAEGECYVKLAKHLRDTFDWRLPKGTWLQIVGEKKYDIETGKVKLKAERVMAASTQLKTGEVGQDSLSAASPVSLATPTQKAKKETILVCQKSDCMKRGGKGVCQALEAALSERGLEDRVTIKGTGCMKNCKGGPNVVMPDKTRYSRIQADEVSAVMDRHFDNQQAAMGSAAIANSGNADFL